MIYNYLEIRFPNGQTQTRFYTKPIQSDDTIDAWEMFCNMDIEVDKKERHFKSEEDRTEEEKKRILTSNTNRSKQTLIELARSNDWEWFATFTFDKEIVDRFDFDSCRKCVITFFNNLKKRKCPNVKYLGVPEQHKNGAWHFHVLISNIDEIVGSFTLHKGDIYNMGSAWKYGFDTISRVKDSKRVSNYILKYITKSMQESTKGKHRFFIVTT